MSTVYKETVVEPVETTVVDGSGTGAMTALLILVVAVVIALVGYFAWYRPTYAQPSTSHSVIDRTSTTNTTTNNTTPAQPPVIIQQNPPAATPPEATPDTDPTPASTG